MHAHSHTTPPRPGPATPVGPDQAREQVRRALAITDETGPAQRTIELTTTGRRTGQPRRIETWFYRLDDAIYLTGRPGARPRQWLLNLGADPRMTIHLTHGVIADLPATAVVITDAGERRRILTTFHAAFRRRNAATGVSTNGTLDDWIARCPLARVDFDDPGLPGVAPGGR